MAGLLLIDEIAAFERVRDYPPSSVTPELRDAVKRLHEVEEIEDFLRIIFHDHADTPHGPAEIVDILTHKVPITDQSGLAAFVLKGRSFSTVRPKDIAHQIYRLEKIDGLALAVLGTTGVVLDAVKEQFSSTCIRLDIAYAFFDADDFARLFCAYGLMCPRDGSVLRGAKCYCGYAPSNNRLNVLQTEAMRSLLEEHHSRKRRCLIVMPTGAGKTRVAAQDAKRQQADRVLYLAHTNEILDVAEAEFSASFGAENVARITNDVTPQTQVTLATIQYVSRHLDDFLSIDYLIVDEFHHASANTYKEAIGQINPAFLLGMTATPFRGDYRDISQICNGNVPVHFDLRAGIDTGILTPYHYFGCFDETDYSDLAISSSGYSIKDLERKLIVPERHTAIVAKWMELAADKPTLAFCCSHEHARRVSAAFEAAGIRSAMYLGSSSPEERGSILRKLRKGELKVICAVDVLNEGADIPFIECLMFLRPTASKRIFLQQLGRGLRQYTGKKFCVIVDFIGNFRNAYQLVEFQDLRASKAEAPIGRSSQSVRDILDLPINCKVIFDDRVLDIFSDQSLNPQYATRGNIGKILVHRYLRISRKLGRWATSKDVDRNEILDSSYYKMIFGTWVKFVSMVRNSYPGEVE